MLDVQPGNEATAPAVASIAPKPTIAELEQMLEERGTDGVTLNPDGSVTIAGHPPAAAAAPEPVAAAASVPAPAAPAAVPARAPDEVAVLTAQLRAKLLEAPACSARDVALANLDVLEDKIEYLRFQFR